MAQLDTRPYPLPELTFEGSFEEGSKAHTEAYAKLEEADKARKPGEVVNGLLFFPVGDGHAIYRVTKQKPLTLQWVPYMDKWSIPLAHIRGLLLADVRQMLDNRRRITALFTKQQT
jgi:hypothetical protein